MRKLFASLLFCISSLWSFEQSVDLLDTSNFWRYGVAGTVLTAYGTNVMGADEAAFEYGMTETGMNGEEVDVFKLIFKWDKKVLVSKGRFTLDWYWMLDIGRFEQRDVQVGDGANDALGITPTFRYAYEYSSWKPYFEIGVGPYLIAHTDYIGRDLTTHFQFGDFVTFGFYVGERKQWNIAYKFFHHSNGEIKHPNNGIGMELFSVGYRY